MRDFFFLLAIVGVVLAAFWYLNRGAAFDADNPYCREIQAKMQQEDYRMSYGERVKAVWNGCI